MVTETDTKSGTVTAEASAPVVTEAPAPQTPEAETPKPEPQIDWKAETGKERAARVKIEGDYRALQGDRRKQGERDAIQQQILEELGANRQAFTVLGRALASGESGTVPDELEEIQTHTRQVLTTRQAENVRQNLINQLYNAAKDGKGKPILDVRTAPEMAEVRETWIAADPETGPKDLVGMALAVAMAERVARQEERTRNEQEKETIVRAAAAKAAKQLEAADINNLDTGAIGGGISAIGDEKWYTEQYAAGKSNDHTRAAKIRRQLKG